MNRANEDLTALVVEDTPREQRFALQALQYAGIRNVNIRSNLADAYSPQTRNRMPYSIVLTDLFFPEVRSTSFQREDRKNNMTKAMEAYGQRIFPLLNKEQYCPVCHVVELKAEELETDVVGAYEWFAENEEWCKEDVEKAIFGMQGYQKYADYVKQLEEVKQGLHIPCGIDVVMRCNESFVPVVVVTDTYHHSNLFECISDQIKAPYVDRVVQDDYSQHKDWDSAVRDVLMIRKSMGNWHEEMDKRLS